MFFLPLATGVMKEEEYDSVVKWFKPGDANLGSFRFLQPTQYCKFGKFKIVEKNQNKFDDCNLGMFKFVEQT
jgi:hypothetical protein